MSVLYQCCSVYSINTGYTVNTVDVINTGDKQNPPPPKKNIVISNIQYIYVCEALRYIKQIVFKNVASN